MEALLAFAAAVLAFRLAGALAARYRARRAPELAAWSASLLAYALASGALAWGAAAGWGEAPFRVYYLFGGLLTAPLLGVGSLLLVGRRWALPVGLVYAGLAIGVAVSEPLAAPVTGTSIPDEGHLDLFPARLLAIVGNVLGTVAALGVAVWTFRRRPLGNGFILVGLAVAALGSSPVAPARDVVTPASIALAALLLYAGFVAPGRSSRSQTGGDRSRASYSGA